MSDTSPRLLLTPQETVELVKRADAMSLPYQSAHPAARTAMLGDKVILASVVAVVLAVTGLPAVYGWLSAPPGSQFMGIVFNVPDTAQYLSWARESMHAVLIDNKLTSEHGPAVYFNLFWFLVGRFAVIVGASLSVATQIARLVAGVVYILAIYWFAGLVLADRRQRWTGTLVAVLGGGLGWLLVVYKLIAGTFPTSRFRLICTPLSRTRFFPSRLFRCKRWLAACWC